MNRIEAAAESQVPAAKANSQSVSSTTMTLPVSCAGMAFVAAFSAAWLVAEELGDGYADDNMHENAVDIAPDSTMAALIDTRLQAARA